MSVFLSVLQRQNCRALEVRSTHPLALVPQPRSSYLFVENFILRDRKYRLDHKLVLGRGGRSFLGISDERQNKSRLLRLVVEGKRENRVAEINCVSNGNPSGIGELSLEIPFLFGSCRSSEII